jgi:hypothetical protein
VSGNRTLVANFTQQSYTISVSANPANGGTVTGGGTFTYGQSCTVVAVSANGYSFASWTENGTVVSTDASYQFTVNGNRTLVANFSQQSYTISVSANPANGGTVSGGGTFTYGQSCTVVAVSATGYAFANWTENGTVVSTDASYQFTVNGNRTLVANFSQQSYTISVSANPSNGGNVSGGGSFNYGESCTVTATANTSYTFTNWTENGTVVSTNARYTFTVNGNRTLVANFTYVPPTYTVSLLANPTDGGTVSGGGTFEQGETCTVNAAANDGYAFDNWTENGTVVSTDARYTFAVNANHTLVANFSPILLPTFTVSVSANPANGGTVTGGGTYTEGQSCTVTATANSGYTFESWTENGIVVSNNARYTFFVNDNRDLVAVFSADPVETYTITATVDPVEGGTVLGAGTYEYGSQATLKVFPNENYTFQNWSENGIIVSEEQEYSFTVTGNRDLVATLLFFDGVGEQTNINITLFPNPVNNKLTIEASEVIDHIEIFNTIGAMVYSQKNSSEKVEIQTADLPVGAYVIRMTTQSATEVRRFLKK